MRAWLGVCLQQRLDSAPAWLAAATVVTVGGSNSSWRQQKQVLPTATAAGDSVCSYPQQQQLAAALTAAPDTRKGWSWLEERRGGDSSGGFALGPSHHHAMTDSMPAHQ